MRNRLDNLDHGKGRVVESMWTLSHEAWSRTSQYRVVLLKMAYTVPYNPGDGQIDDIDNHDP